MKTVLYIAITLVLILISAVVYNIFTNAPSEDNISDSKEDERTPEAYFAENIASRAIQDVGKPIEGFDAELLMVAYPGLQPSDFNGVATMEGAYTVTGDELSFVRTESQPISSAERSITDTGYATLLVNLAGRLGIQADDSVAVDAILDAINTVERVDAGINGQAVAFGVTITPLAVIEDSRCPIGVECVQAGTVRIRVLIESADGSSETMLTFGEPLHVGGVNVLFGQVAPVAEDGVAIEDESYRFSFQMSR